MVRYMILQYLQTSKFQQVCSLDVFLLYHAPLLLSSSSARHKQWAHDREERGTNFNDRRKNRWCSDLWKIVPTPRRCFQGHSCWMFRWCSSGTPSRCLLDTIKTASSAREQFVSILRNLCQCLLICCSGDVVGPLRSFCLCKAGAWLAGYRKLPELLLQSLDPILISKPERTGRVDRQDPQDPVP